MVVSNAAAAAVVSAIRDLHVSRPEDDLDSLYWGVSTQSKVNLQPIPSRDLRDSSNDVSAVDAKPQ